MRGRRSFRIGKNGENSIFPTFCGSRLVNGWMKKKISKSDGIDDVVCISDVALLQGNVDSSRRRPTSFSSGEASTGDEDDVFL